MRLILGLILLVFSTATTVAVSPDECEQQRAQYPRNWADVSNEQALFDCSSHYVGGMRVKIGASDNGGRTMLSLVPLNMGKAGLIEDTTQTIYRIWLDKEQLERLKTGKYFATVLRTEPSCWIRGDLDKGAIFFMDNSNPPADGPDAGSFYNKSPRISAFEDNAYECRAVK